MTTRPPRTKYSPWDWVVLVGLACFVGWAVGYGLTLLAGT